jgi:uncharacterized protein YlxW (UPF0749 family)
MNVRKLFNQTNILLAMLMCLFGFILISHVKSVKSDAAMRNIAERYKLRQAELQAAETQYQSLLDLNAQLNQQKADAIANLLNQEGYDNLLTDLERYKVLAGFTEVRGPGVILTLDDKPGFDSMNPWEIIHDKDVMNAIDLLRSAGAAAISVNDLRVTAFSYITCIGPTIKCNNQRMTPPYIIKAIGDTAALFAALRDNQNFIARQTNGIQFKIDESPEVVIPPFAEADDAESYIGLLEVRNP